MKATIPYLAIISMVTAVHSDVKKVMEDAIVNNITGRLEEILAGVSEKDRKYYLAEAIFDDYDFTALELAVFCEHLEMVEMLLLLKAPIRRVNVKRTALHVAAKNGVDVALLELLLKKCDKECLEVENEAGFNVLLLAISANAERNVRKILEYGANPYALNSKTRATALHCVAKAGNANIFELLWEKGVCHVDAVDRYGITPLMEAASGGKTDMMTALLRKNAMIDSACAELGYTALHYAVFYGNKEAVALLLEWNVRADVKGKNSCKKKASDIAAEKSYNEIALMLDEYEIARKKEEKALKRCQKNVANFVKDVLKIN